MQAIYDLIASFFTWLLNLLKEFVQFVQDFLYDITVKVFEEVLGIISSVIGSIPVPSGLSGGLQSFLNGVDPGILYFLGKSGFASAVAIIGAGYAFRMTRKVLTLFQW